MNVKIEELGNSVAKLTIELPPEELEKGLEIAYRKNARKYSVAGFRKGHAPRYIIERAYGPQVFYEGACEALCWERYRDAVKEKGLRPVEAPRIDVVTIAKGEPFVYTATVTLAPEPTLGRYKGLTVPYERPLVTEDDVDKAIAREADKASRLIPVEDRPSQVGDTLAVDYEGFIDGVPFEGGKAEGQNIVLGSGRYIPGFEAGFTGRRAGEEAEISVTFPEDYGAKELAGREATFHVKVHSIKAKETPAIDDEFAQDVSEFDTLAEYKQDVRKKLEEQAQATADARYDDALVAAVVEGSSVDVPKVMVDNQYEVDYKEQEMLMAYRGMEFERYLESLGDQRKEYEQQLRAAAERRVRARVVLEAIARAESLEATDEDLEAAMEAHAKSRGTDAEAYRKGLSEDDVEYMRNQETSKKIMAFLRENNPREREKIVVEK